MISKSDDSNFRDSDGTGLFDDRGELPIREDTSLSIGNVSRAFRVSRPRLWAYERLGLIKRHNRFGQGFVYAWEDCARLFFIIKARNVGVSALQLAPLIRAVRPGATAKSIKRARSKCLDLMERLDLRRRALREALAEIRFYLEMLSEKLPDAGGNRSQTAGDSFN